MEAIRGICYKLRMMGVPFSHYSYVYGDNMSVIQNTQRPESTLRNKSNYICYYAVCDYVAMVETNTAHIYTHDNGYDLLTKVLYGAKRKNIVGKFMHDSYD